MQWLLRSFMPEWHFIFYPFIRLWIFRCFCVLAVKNSAAVRIGVHAPFQIVILSGVRWKGSEQEL